MQNRFDKPVIRYNSMKELDTNLKEISGENMPPAYANNPKATGPNGHGGMDYVMDARLVYCLQHGLPLDMDVYDMAEWCCLAELGSLSMDNGNCAVSFPDFTRGYWNLVDGYGHAWATAEQEAAVNAASEAYTAGQKAAVQAFDLWNLYDAAQSATGEAKEAAVKAYEEAAAKARAIYNN